MQSSSWTNRIATCLMAALTLFSGCNADSEPERFGFSGTVTVDGKPAHRMIVQLTHLDPQVGELERYASSKTDEAGEFIFGARPDGTSSGFQGAVAGKYAVTFSWLTSDDLEATDKLNGRFAEASRSKFQITLPRNQTDAPVEFALQSRP